MKKPVVALILFVLMIAGALFASHLLAANKAQQQSSFISQYAKSQHFMAFKTIGDAGKGPDNAMPWYEMYYQTTDYADTVKSSLETLLQRHGYMVADNYFNPTPCLTAQGILAFGTANCPSGSNLTGLANNGGKSYWVIYARNSATIVKAEITNVSYADPSTTKDLYNNILGQHPVPDGLTVLSVTVSSR